MALRRSQRAHRRGRLQAGAEDGRHLGRRGGRHRPRREGDALLAALARHGLPRHQLYGESPCLHVRILTCHQHDSRQGAAEGAEERETQRNHRHLQAEEGRALPHLRPLRLAHTAEGEARGTRRRRLRHRPLRPEGRLQLPRPPRLGLRGQPDTVAAQLLQRLLRGVWRRLDTLAAHRV